MYGERDDELPHEVILAIKRILNLQQSQNDDPLDSLSNEFSPVDLLNSYFPDGILYKYL
jgi:vacuolar protein sorting-associated protein 53